MTTELSGLSCFHHTFTKNSMHKFFIMIKEATQYAGIIILSLLSALWLLIRRKRIT